MSEPNAVPVSESMQLTKLRRKKWLMWCGVGLIILSFVLYAGLLVIPFIAVGAPAKVAMGTICVILGEVTFWLGGALVGTTLLARYRRFLDPRSWFGRRV